MKRLLSALMASLLMLALASPAALAAFTSDAGVDRDTIGGPILLADYPSNEYLQSFDGAAFDWYREVYSYEDVGVIVTNERCSRFDRAFDEILTVSEAYGKIKSARLVEMDPIEGAETTVHLRFECTAQRETQGPKKWIVDVVKVYQSNYCFMFTVARDANGKDYSKKTDALIASLHIGEASEATENASGNFFAPDGEEDDGQE